MKNDFSQYAAMVSQLARRWLALITPPTGALQQSNVLLGLPAAQLLLDDAPELYDALADGSKRLAQLACETTTSNELVPQLRDPAGHYRDIYWPLVLHLYLAAFTRRYESLSNHVWGPCDDSLTDAIATTRWIEAFAGARPSSNQIPTVLWSAVCLLDHAMLNNRDADIELVDTIIHQIVTSPGSDGALHPRDEKTGHEESLDTWTYRELSGLHALANLAFARRNQSWAKRVKQITMYHQENTQPDNTTHQPWAVFAFLWSPQTRNFGEQQLHDATLYAASYTETPRAYSQRDTRVHPSGGLGIIAGMLLADATIPLDALLTS